MEKKEYKNEYKQALDELKTIKNSSKDYDEYGYGFSNEIKHISTVLQLAEKEHEVLKLIKRDPVLAGLDYSPMTYTVWVKVMVREGRLTEKQAREVVRNEEEYALLREVLYK